MLKREREKNRGVNTVSYVYALGVMGLTRENSQRHVQEITVHSQMTRCHRPVYTVEHVEGEVDTHNGK